jgi:hypothetical protein
MPSEKDAPLITGSAAVPCLENVEFSVPFLNKQIISGTETVWLYLALIIPLILFRRGMMP